MKARELWQTLDAAGLVPSIHWLAAPHEWRAALLEIEDRYGDMWDNLHAASVECSRANTRADSLADEVAALKKKLAEIGKAP